MASGSRATSAYVVLAVNDDGLPPAVYENLLGGDQVARRDKVSEAGGLEDR